MPSDADEVNAVIVGRLVSTDMLRAELQDEFALPAASVTALGPTQMFALPLFVSAVGVNTAVYVVPEPLKLPNDPLSADDGHRWISVSSNPVTDSENVNVMVTV